MSRLEENLMHIQRQPKKKKTEYGNNQKKNKHVANVLDAMTAKPKIQLLNHTLKNSLPRHWKKFHKIMNNYNNFW